MAGGAADAVAALTAVHLAALVIAGALSHRRSPGWARMPSGWGWALLLGLAVRALWLPLGRHEFDGHEADYFDLWRGLPEEATYGYRFYPAVAALYQGLGALLGGSEAALLGVSIALGLAAIAAVMAWLRALEEPPRLALAVGVALALDAIHAFWSTSGYNVALPLAAGLWALCGLTAALERRSAPLMALAGLLAALAVATRVESLALLLPAGVLLAEGRMPVGARLRLVAWALPGVVLAALHLGLAPAPEGGPSQGLGYALQMLAWQWDLTALLAPWGPAWMWAPALAGLAHARWARRRAGAVMLACAALHLPLALFDDYGTRHTLVVHVGLAYGALALIHALLRGAPPARALGAAVGAALLLGLGQGLVFVRDRYYATAAQFWQGEALLREGPALDLARQPARCVYITESWFYRQQSTASHFELLDPGAREALIGRSDGCIFFVYDLENYKLSSRSIWERGIKIHHIFRPTPVGRRVVAELEDYSVLYRITLPPDAGR